MRHVFVGMDSAKDKCEAGIKDRAGNQLIETFTFLPNEKGVGSLLEKVRDVCKEVRATPVFGIEATGIYHLPVYAKLEDEGYLVKVYNPIQLKAFRNKNLRKTKTDKIDCLLIADMLRYETIPNQRKLDPEILELRELCRVRYRLVKRISNAKRQVRRDMNVIFRGYDKLFNDVFGTSSMLLLKKYTTPKAILELGEEKLTSLLKKSSRGRLGRAKAVEILDACRVSITPRYMEEACVMEIRYLLFQIELIEEQVKELEEKIRQRFSRFQQPIVSIDGIGSVIAAVVYSEVGDIKDFETPEQVVAFAGLDPSVKESGKYVSNRHHISKRGSPYLRHGLYQAASSAKNCNLICARVYQKKRSEGLTHKAAICVVARKLIHIIFSVWKNNKPFYVPANGGDQLKR